MLKGSIDTLSTRPHGLTNVDGAYILTDEVAQWTEMSIHLCLRPALLSGPHVGDMAVYGRDK